MKRILSLVLAAICIVAMIPMGVMATTDPTWTISSAEGLPGETVSVKISISNNPGFCAAVFEIDYDKTRLRLDSASFCAPFSSAMVLVDNLPHLAFFKMDGNVTTNGDFVILNFTILSTASAGDATVSISYDEDNVSNLAEETVRFTMASGKVTVVNCRHTNTTNVAAQAATCTTKGYTAGVYCNDCKTYISGHEEVNTLDHTYNQKNTSEDYLKEAATCHSKAVYYYSCTCGATGTDTFEYGNYTSDHTFDRQSTATNLLKSAATCQSKAVYYYSCVCGAKGSTTFEYGDFAAHTFTKQSTATDYLKSNASCNAKAVYYYSCVLCGAAGTDTFEAGEPSHSFAVTEVVKPTPDVQGYTLHTCSKCQATMTDTFTTFDFDHTPYVEVVGKKVQVGKAFTVDVILHNNPGIAYLEMSPKIPTALDLSEVKDKSILGEFTSGAQQYLWLSEENHFADGTLLTFTFTTAENTPAGTYVVDFVLRKCYNEDETDVEIYVKQGEIVVIDIVYGDATGNGVVDGADLLRLKKYIANLNYDTGMSTITVSPGADATGNGVVDGADLLRLKKYIANYNYDTETSTIVLGPTK